MLRHFSDHKVLAVFLQAPELLPRERSGLEVELRTWKLELNYLKYLEFYCMHDKAEPPLNPARRTQSETARGRVSRPGSNRDASDRLGPNKRDRLTSIRTMDPIGLQISSRQRFRTYGSSTSLGGVQPVCAHE